MVPSKSACPGGSDYVCQRGLFYQVFIVPKNSCIVFEALHLVLTSALSKAVFDKMSSECQGVTSAVTSGLSAQRRMLSR